MEIIKLPLIAKHCNTVFGENFMSEEFTELILKVVKDQINYDRISMIPKLVLFISKNYTAYSFHHGKQKANPHQRQGDCTHTHLEAKDRDQPGGDRGTNIGAHDHTDGFGQGQQARIGKTDHHQGSG